MLDRKINKKGFILLILIIQLTWASVEVSIDAQNKQQCECLNGGTCSNNNKYMACNCPSGYIGSKCQTIASEISQIPKQTLINQSYSYFYFQPKEINYYQFNLKICLPQNLNHKFTTLLFLEVQSTAGKLKLQPSIYQTSPLTFQPNQDRCKVFNTHFIPIRKMLNDRFQKIVFGISIKNNTDPVANRWVNFLQKNMINSQESFNINQISQGQLNDNMISNQPQIQSQKIQISCTYQVYLVQNYWGTFILVMSAITLLTSTAAFFYVLRKNFPISMSNQDIIRMYAANPEQFSTNQNIKNDLSHFGIIMPIMSYELVVQKEKRAQKMYPMNFLKRRIQASNEIEGKQHQFSKIGLGQPNLDLNEQLSYCEDSGLRIQNTCNICLLNFEKTEKVRQTPCKHIFHQDCIDSWCETALNCPVCRQSLEMPRVGNKKQLQRSMGN